MEDFRQCAKHILGLVHVFLQDVSQKNDAGTADIAVAADGDFSAFHVGLEPALDFARVAEVDRLDFIERNKVVGRNQTWRLAVNVAEQFGARHGSAADKPAVLSDTPEKIGFACALGREFNEIDTRLDERQQPGKHRVLFRPVLSIPLGVVVDRAQQDVEPFLGRERLSRFAIDVQVDRVGAEVFVFEKREAATAAFVIGSAISELHKSPTARGLDEIGLDALPHVIFNDRFRLPQAQIRNGKGILVASRIEGNFDSSEESPGLAFTSSRFLEFQQIFAPRNDFVDVPPQGLRIVNATVRLRLALHNPVAQERGDRGGLEHRHNVLIFENGRIRKSFTQFRGVSHRASYKSKSSFSVNSTGLSA